MSSGLAARFLRTDGLRASARVELEHVAHAARAQRRDPFGSALTVDLGELVLVAGGKRGKLGDQVAGDRVERVVVMFAAGALRVLVEQASGSHGFLRVLGRVV
jgi:hypothetical protein